MSTDHFEHQVQRINEVRGKVSEIRRAIREAFFRCPECGGQVQATDCQETWWTIDSDGVPYLYGEPEHLEIRVYCENDHEIDGPLAAEVRLLIEEQRAGYEPYDHSRAKEDRRNGLD